MENVNKKFLIVSTAIIAGLITYILFVKQHRKIVIEIPRMTGTETTSTPTNTETK